MEKNIFMTPKEKAEDLIIKFDSVIYTDQDHDNQVKKCALIAVDEIVRILAIDFEDGDLRENLLRYYLEVKHEINNL